MENLVELSKKAMQAIFNGVYKGRSVFVTGHTGFKGSWLTLSLGSLGAKLAGYSLNPTTHPAMFKVANISGDISSTIADIRDYDRLLSAMQHCQPDIVFHLAAQPIVRRSYVEPKLTFETNVLGTVNVLEAVRNTPSVRVCVNVTSDKCYENKEWVYSYRENDPMGGYDPYSSSKGCAELAAAAYRHSFFHPDNYESHGVSLVSVRAGNIIGGGDWAEDRIIPDCVRALSRNIPIPIRNPSAVRPWQYVLDPISAYLWIGALLWRNPTMLDYGWNIGPPPSRSMSVGQIVEAVIKIWGRGCWEDKSDPQAAHEANILRLDCSKASNLLNWRSCYNEAESVEAAMRWYYKYYNDSKFNAREYSLSQIGDFVRKAKSKGLDWAKETP